MGPRSRHTPLIPRAPSVDNARRMRAFLRESGYTESGLKAALGSAEPPVPHLRNLPRFLDRTRDESALSVLVRLFFLDVALSKAAVRRTLPDWFIGLCRDYGLLVDQGEDLHSRVLMVPYAGLLLASDPYRRLSTRERFDHVLTVNPATQHLANFAMRTRVRSTLDLGTGCGVQALLAAASSQEVVATDVNPRAIAYAEFNSRLNGLENIHCVTGDGFAPVRGKTFDRILCNPPFVLAPSTEYVYRDSGLELDLFCRRLIEEAPALLLDGGCFQMIFEWAQLEDDSDWRTRVMPWLEGTGCDVWLLKRYTQCPEWYAQTRLRETMSGDPQEDAAQYARWMDHYRTVRLKAVHGGLIIMRRRSGQNWVRLEDLDQSADEPFGYAVERALASFDFLAAHPDNPSLMDQRPRLSEDARLEQRYRVWDAGWRIEVIRLYLARGLPRSVNVDGDIANFLVEFDGTRTIGEAIEKLAAEATAPRAQVEGEALAVVRRMIELGFLLPDIRSP